MSKKFHEGTLMTFQKHKVYPGALGQAEVTSVL